MYTVQPKGAITFSSFSFAGAEFGYNVPEVSLCEELTDLLSDKGFKTLIDDGVDELNPTVKRFFTDPYLCFYR